MGDPESAKNEALELSIEVIRAVNLAAPIISQIVLAVKSGASDEELSVLVAEVHKKFRENQQINEEYWRRRRREREEGG